MNEVTVAILGTSGLMGRIHAVGDANIRERRILGATEDDYPLRRHRGRLPSQGARLPRNCLRAAR